MVFSYQRNGLAIDIGGFFGIRDVCRGLLPLSECVRDEIARLQVFAEWVGSSKMSLTNRNLYSVASYYMVLVSREMGREPAAIALNLEMEAI